MRSEGALLANSIPATVATSTLLGALVWVQSHVEFAPAWQSQEPSLFMLETATGAFLVVTVVAWRVSWTRGTDGSSDFFAGDSAIRLSSLTFSSAATGSDGWTKGLLEAEQSHVSPSLARLQSHWESAKPKACDAVKKSARLRKRCLYEELMLKPFIWV